MAFAFVFESVGAGEWFVLLAVLLIVMGPKNIPSTLRKIGNYYAKFRRAADSFKRQLMDMDYELERQMKTVEKEVSEVKDSIEEPPVANENETTAEPSADNKADVAQGEVKSDDERTEFDYGNQFD